MKFAEYQLKAAKTAIYPGKDEGNLSYPALGLSGEAGEVLLAFVGKTAVVAEIIKKHLRDDDSQLTRERQLRIKSELGDVLWYVARLASEAGLSLNEIAEENIAKLASRQSRGVLRGSGSDR